MLSLSLHLAFQRTQFLVCGINTFCLIIKIVKANIENTDLKK